MTDDPVEDPTFLGALSEALSDLIEAQSAELFAERGIAIPVKSMRLMLALEAGAPMAAGDLARALGRSHQLVIQKLPKLLKLGLIERTPCPEDRRRQLLRVTPRGREALERFRAAQPDIRRAYAGLADETGDVHARLRAALVALDARPLAARARR